MPTYWGLELPAVRFGHLIYDLMMFILIGKAINHCTNILLSPFDVSIAVVYDAECPYWDQASLNNRKTHSKLFIDELSGQ